MIYPPSSHLVTTALSLTRPVGGIIGTFGLDYTGWLIGHSHNWMFNVRLKLALGGRIKVKRVGNADSHGGHILGHKYTPYKLEIDRFTKSRRDISSRWTRRWNYSTRNREWRTGRSLEKFFQCRDVPPLQALWCYLILIKSGYMFVLDNIRILDDQTITWEVNIIFTSIF